MPSRLSSFLHRRPWPESLPGETPGQGAQGTGGMTVKGRLGVPETYAAPKASRASIVGLFNDMPSPLNNSSF